MGLRPSLLEAKTKEKESNQRSNIVCSLLVWRPRGPSVLIDPQAWRQLPFDEKRVVCERPGLMNSYDFTENQPTVFL